MQKIKIGVLALQGGFEAHAQKLLATNASHTGAKRYNLEIVLVKTTVDLEGLHGLMLPGGESSVLLKLCSQELQLKIKKQIEQNMPVLATCAGLIFLAKTVLNPSQHSLEVFDITVERNAYGRQVDSFVTNRISWTDKGKKFLAEMSSHNTNQISASEQPQHIPNTLEGVFIRAPKIVAVGPKANVLLELDHEPVLVQQGNCLGATFHPELTAANSVIHELFLTSCAKLAA